MNDTESPIARSGFSGAQVALIVLAAMLVSAGLSYWLIRTYVTPTDFTPVTLSPAEQTQLDGKLRVLGFDPFDLLPAADRKDPVDAVDKNGRLIPQKYEENPEKRHVRMSERELNAVVAANPDLARRLAIDLSDNLASARLLIPMDPDFPLMGGKILRVNAGLELAYREGHPVVKLRGISVMGVPLPNAWLGNLKNVDLVEEFGDGSGFWSSFAAGVNLIEVNDGQLYIQLKE